VLGRKVEVADGRNNEVARIDGSGGPQGRTDHGSDGPRYPGGILAPGTVSHQDVEQLNAYSGMAS